MKLESIEFYEQPHQYVVRTKFDESPVEVLKELEILKLASKYLKEKMKQKICRIIFTVLRLESYSPTTKIEQANFYF